MASAVTEQKTRMDASWPNILLVNGRRANFSLVRDATIEKERSSFFERLLMTQEPVQHEKYVKILSVFAVQSDICKKRYRSS